MSRMYKFFILNSILLIGFTIPLAAQQEKPIKKEVKKEIKEDSVALWQGMMFEYDVAPYVERFLVQKYAFSQQGNVQINLKNKYFPVAEIGFSHSSKTTMNDVKFSANGLYGKLGIDVRVIQPKPTATIKDNFFLAGLRFGVSNFNYSLNNFKIEDGYWGGSEIVNQNNLNTTKFWFEIAASMKVSVYKNFYMGWTIRNKHLINPSNEGDFTPWYVPGYGIGDTSAWGISYTVGYYFRGKTKNETKKETKDKRGELKKNIIEN